MSVDNLALVSFHLVMFQIVWHGALFFSKLAYIWRSSWRSIEKPLLFEKLLVQELPVSSTARLRLSDPASPPSLCLQSNGRLAERSWIFLDGGPTGGHRSDLHGWERASLGMIHPSAHR